jgi:hypothetical protein
MPLWLIAQYKDGIQITIGCRHMLINLAYFVGYNDQEHI